MNREIKVTRCKNVCPFYGNSMDGMECNHPHWEGKGAYENMIITQTNSIGGNIPEKCPLREDKLTIVYKL